jgi:hypothetical protein
MTRPMPMPPRRTGDPTGSPVRPGPMPGMPPMPPGEFPGPGPVGAGQPMAPEIEPEGDELAGEIEPPGPEPEPPEGVSGGQLFTDSQVSYHGPQEVCGTCDYFQSPNACLVVMGAKDESGWCVLHSARAQGGGEAPLPSPPMEEE